MNVRVRLFGAFRDLGESVLSLEIPAGTTIAEVRRRLAAEMCARHPGFRHLALLERSALGDEAEILSDERRLERETDLALLPPVCGG